MVFVVNEIEHSFFKRKGNDLLVDINLSLKEALLGFQKKIRTLDNRFVVFENQGVTQPNQKFTIRNEGMPKVHFPSEKGNLLITCKITMPDELNAEQIDLFKEFFSLA